jgi:hypothetical protein
MGESGVSAAPRLEFNRESPPASVSTHFHVWQRRPYSDAKAVNEVKLRWFAWTTRPFAKSPCV